MSALRCASVILMPVSAAQARLYPSYTGLRMYSGVSTLLLPTLLMAAVFPLPRTSLSLYSLEKLKFPALPDVLSGWTDFSVLDHCSKYLLNFLRAVILSYQLPKREYHLSASILLFLWHEQFSTSAKLWLIFLEIALQYSEVDVSIGIWTAKVLIAL